MLCALLAFAAAPLTAAADAASYSSESGNPINDQGSSYNYRSNITAVSPNVGGLNVTVLEFADRLLLANHTGQTVTIYGYQGEPYARVLPDGTTEQNTRSPATYLNTNFYANVSVPPSASASAAPRWSVVSKTGQFGWHDHRIHWMSPVTPPQVKDKGKRTLIFNWTVPISVGQAKGAIAGQLFWTPASSSAPIAAIVAGAVIVLGGLALVLLVRRRRAREDAPTGATRSAGAQKEAW